MPPDTARSARRALLALSVLDDVDVDPHRSGWVVRSADGVNLLLHLREVQAAVGPCDPDSPEAIARVRAWVALRTHLAPYDTAELVRRARPLALPVGHALHPGPSWVITPVLGGALDLGLGVRGVPGDPEAVAVLHPEMREAAGGHCGAMVEHAMRYLGDIAALASSRQRRDQVAPLRPLGDCDVVTLLASRAFRETLVSVDPTGIRTAAVPMRTRGWLDLGRIDPAFALAAAAATEPHERGFERPVMITAEEITLARSGTRQVSFGILDAVADDHRAEGAASPA